MTVGEAINRIDALKHNTYTQGEKIAWLSGLDAMVKRQILDTHAGCCLFPFYGYRDGECADTELLVPAPFEDIYLRWLEAQMDYANGEYDKYNNSILMFQTIYDAFANDFNRTHLPKGGTLRFY